MLMFPPRMAGDGPVRARQLLKACALIMTLAPANVSGQPAPSTAAARQPGDAADDETSLEASRSATAAEAAQRYDRGLELYSEGELKLAVIEFERAYQLIADYRTLYNIGQVYIQLGRYARAHQALETYLELGAGAVPQERREAVERDLRMLGTRVAQLSVELNIDGASVAVDGTTVGVSPLPGPLLVDAGAHEVTAKLSGYQSDAAQLTLAGQDTRQLTLALHPIPKTTPQVIVNRPIPEAESSTSTWKWATWTTAGVLAVGSGVTALLGAGAATDLDDKRTSLEVSRAELDSASRRAQTLLGVADVLGALAILSGGTALYITLSDEEGSAHEPPAKSGGHVGLSILPTQVTIGGSY